MGKRDCEKGRGIKKVVQLFLPLYGVDLDFSGNFCKMSYGLFIFIFI